MLHAYPSVRTPPDEAELERLIVDAEIAGRRTVADALADRLAAIRAGRAGSSGRRQDELIRRRRKG